MTRFRPCIDLHAGQVKQIVGGTLTENGADLKTNYVSSHSAGYYANLYKETNCLGAHVIMLGPGNDDAAREALAAWPGRLQVGGGITDKNAKQWIDAGAEKVRSCVLNYSCEGSKMANRMAMAVGHRDIFFVSRGQILVTSIAVDTGSA